MAQQINVLWNNSFVNLTIIPLLYEKTVAIALAQTGLTTGWQDIRLAGHQAGSQADELLLHLEILKDETLEIQQCSEIAVSLQQDQ